MTDEDRRARIETLVNAALDLKAEDVVALDVRELTSYTDTFVIVTASSDRRARSITDSVTEAAKALGDTPIGVEGYDEGRWILIDLGDVIVHVFQEDVRRDYDLERLWSDAPAIEVAGCSQRTATS